MMLEHIILGTDESPTFVGSRYIADNLVVSASGNMLTAGPTVQYDPDVVMMHDATGEDIVPIPGLGEGGPIEIAITCVG